MSGLALGCINSAPRKGLVVGLTAAVAVIDDVAPTNAASSVRGNWDPDQETSAK